MEMFVPESCFKQDLNFMVRTNNEKLSIMKKLVLILGMLFLVVRFGLGQNPNVTIVGQIIGYDGRLEVKYCISPYPNSKNIDSIRPDITGKFVINKLITATQFFHMSYRQDSIVHTCRLILRPNNYYKFVSNGYAQDDNNPNSYYSPEIFSLKYKVEGSPYLETDAGQVYFNLIDNGTMGSIYLNEWDLNHPGSLIDTLQARIVRQKSIFKDLFEKEKIDSGFYMLASLNVEYFNAYKLATSIFSTWQSHEFAISDTVIRNELYKIYPKIFELYPVKGVNLEWLWHFENYVGLYLCFREDYINGEFKPKVRKSSDYLKTMQTSDDVLTKEANAHFKIQTGMTYVGNFDQNASLYGKELLEKYPQYKGTSVGQFLEDYLIPRAEKFEGLSKEELPSNAILLDRTNQINYLEQLLDSLKGRPALIDCWATWCLPCIGQFNFTKDLKPFLKKHDIQMVYIAFELDDKREKWENYIKQFELSGYHLVANEKVKKQLKVLFDGYVSLPTFMIVDSNGNILLKNAAFPSDGDKLYKQLKDLLKL
jgi:thiol-disulfide isomerase/thioredoxin